MSRIKLTGLTFLAISVTLCGGCAKLNLFARHSKNPSQNDLLAVTAQQTPFYRYGPQQTQGADRQLPRDTVVTLVRHSFGYSRVRLEDGQQGFVANDDVAKAPERLIAQLNGSNNDATPLPPTPPVKLPTSDPPSPEFEPTPLPQSLMPQP
jgi:hypothetical protein